MILKEQTKLLKFEAYQHPVKLITETSVSPGKTAPMPLLIFPLYLAIALFSYQIIYIFIGKPLFTKLRKF